ncbi:MAG TPA: hypothetical protein VIB59_00435, partial [Solirubrobacteraceae bacterium]
MAATRKRTRARSSKAVRAPARRGRGARTRGGRGRPRGLAALGFSMPAALPRMPVLDQRQRDVLGLALAALGIFIGFVLYGGGHGGRAGRWLVVAFGWAVGGARELAPVALVLGGGILLLRPVLPAVRPLRTGAICLFAAITLALAAGTLGVSSGPAAAHAARDAGSWSSAHLQTHGGVVGEALYQGTHRLVATLGVSILVVFLFLVGVTLLTGASLATLIRATGSGLMDTTRLVRSRVAAREDGALADQTVPAAAAAQLAPEPPQGGLVVRSTHVEAPSHDEPAGEDRWDEDPEDGASPAESAEQEQIAPERPTGGAGAAEHEDLPGVARADPGELTPQGRLRESVTGDPDFV